MGARLSRNCVDIIQRLCCDQEMRLGRGGAKEIKSHPWFKVRYLIFKISVLIFSIKTNKFNELLILGY